MLKFEISNKPKSIALDKDLKKIAKTISKKHKKDGDVSIAFVDKKTIKYLNKAYRGKDKPTDILTFVFDDQDSIGEIILNYEQARLRAKQEKIPIKKTVLRLTVHGICHILGYSHKKDTQAKKMENYEESIIKEF